jgi:hypothetical protein
MAATYTPIASITLGANASSVTFSSIPQTYTDLVLVMNGAGLIATQNSQVQFNSDTGTNYSYTAIYGTGSVAGSARGTNATNGGSCSLSNGQAVIIYHFLNYSNTTTYKTFIGRGNNPSTTSEVDIRASLWRSTSAITSIVLGQSGSGGGFASGFTFNLYGILGANA